MQEFEAGILRTDSIGLNSFIMDLSCDEIAKTIQPGQFVQVRVSTGTDPFLRRTFSVCGADREMGILRLLIDVVGPGTELVYLMKRGGTLNVIGPLGSSFDTELGGDDPCIMVAGGAGAAPLIFLSKLYAKRAARPVTFMMGGRTAKVLEVTDLLGSGVDVLTSTDDGSAGYKGLVSDLLINNLDTIKPSAIYTCGPAPMMKAIGRIASEHSIACQVSLEERMACGIGACLGCAVELTNGRMVRSCVEGPVFNSSEVIL